MAAKRSLGFFGGKVELRKADDGNGLLVGLAVPYGQWSNPIYGYFKEQFRSGAFADSLAKKRDVICCVDHRFEKLLGRTNSGTLKLTDSEDGLRAECKMPNTTYARDLAESISRGDVAGMSFTFDSVDEEWGKTDGMSTRTITKANLYEVCFTGMPAYSQTTAALRSMNVFDEEELRALVERHTKADQVGSTPPTQLKTPLLDFANGWLKRNAH